MKLRTDATAPKRAIASGAFGQPRAFFGKTEDRASALVLRDAAGHAQLRLGGWSRVNRLPRRPRQDDQDRRALKLSASAASRPALTSPARRRERARVRRRRVHRRQRHQSGAPRPRNPRPVGTGRTPLPTAPPARSGDSLARVEPPLWLTARKRTACGAREGPHAAANSESAQDAWRLSWLVSAAPRWLSRQPHCSTLTGPLRKATASQALRIRRCEITHEGSITSSGVVRRHWLRLDRHGDV